MKCEDCSGTGDGRKKGDGKCSVCLGTGTACDVCGESAEIGQTMCEDCLLDDPDADPKSGGTP